MRKTCYACDWCQVEPLTATETYQVIVTPVEKLLPRELDADICIPCFRKLQDCIQRIAVRARDERELNSPDAKPP